MEFELCAMSYAGSSAACFLFCPNAELFWAELRCRLQVELYMDWRSAKLVEFGTGPDSKCLVVLALLGLHAIYKSRTDHILVLEGGKPAWRLFEEGFTIAISLVAEVGNPEMAGLAELEARFKIPKTPRNRRRQVRNFKATECDWGHELKLL